MSLRARGYRLSALRLLALGLFSAAAGPHAQPSFQQQRLMDQAMNAPQYIPPRKMRVYLKDGTRNPPLDSFHLSSGKTLLWRHEKEDALLFHGKTIEYRGDEIDSIILENGQKGMPYRKWMIFLNQAGPINYYGLAPDTTGAMPFFIQKGSEELVRPGSRAIRDRVEDDPEAAEWMTRYGHRFLWKAGIAATGLGMFMGGFAWYNATRRKDEQGHLKDGYMPAAIFGTAGLVVFAVPFTSWLDFIWKGMPKRALDVYNRNHRSAP